MTAQALENTKQAEKNDGKTLEKVTCGIIMPIATMSPEYTEEHWQDVRAIIDTAIKRAGFEPRIVSDSEDSTIIHKSIINNIYNDEIIVCDVSNKNANVMFELGMRLAFNKPVVIIKDDKTGYSFDTSNIEHIGYRKDLRHNTVEKFINDLARKIKATHEAPRKGDYQSFLSHFGKFEVAKIENKSIEGSEALEKLLNKIEIIENKLNQNFENFHSNSSSYSINDYKRIKHPGTGINIKSDYINLNNLPSIINDITNNIGDIKDIDYDIENKTLKLDFNKQISIIGSMNLEEKVKRILEKYKI